MRVLRHQKEAWSNFANSPLGNIYNEIKCIVNCRRKLSAPGEHNLPAEPAFIIPP